MGLQIKLSKKAEKQIVKAPKEISEAVRIWVKSLKEIGLEATRKQGGNGMHDEPLKGKMAGLRSIRLNKAWRLYYSVDNGLVTIVTIQGIDKHEYKN